MSPRWGERESRFEDSGDMGSGGELGRCSSSGGRPLVVCVGDGVCCSGGLPCAGWLCCDGVGAAGAAAVVVMMSMLCVQGVDRRVM